MDYFGHSTDSPTKSALVQQKYKFLAQGWDYLFHIFIQGCHDLHDNTWRGHRILACDGSDANIARDPADENTFIHEGQSGYNAIHINALYDLQTILIAISSCRARKNCMNGKHSMT